MVNTEAYSKLKSGLQADVRLVAVSKFKPASDVQVLYEAGQRDFGENYVQELLEKQAALPADIRWHFIGHLQSNKVKFIAPFVHLIHGVDSLKLLKEINKQAIKNNRRIPVLLQVHIAEEETKFGLDETELDQLMTAVRMAPAQWNGVLVSGLMGMASFSENQDQVKKEFTRLSSLYTKYKYLEEPSIQFQTLSMGMSGDYDMAISCGSNMIRIGSMLFGARS